MMVVHGKERVRISATRPGRVEFARSILALNGDVHQIPPETHEVYVNWGELIIQYDTNDLDLKQDHPSNQGPPGRAG